MYGLAPWGLLPLALPLVWFTVRGLAGLTTPRGSFESLLAGATLTVMLIAAGVRLLGAAGQLTTPVLIGSLAVVAGTVTTAVRIRGVDCRLPWRRAVSVDTIPLLVVVAGALVIAAAAAYYLPVWQWDALGYHLPFVNFALQDGTFADIPHDVPYLSTYPHIVEYTFVGWRAMIPDDRLVELAHIPLGLLGALAIATIARHQGARPEYAVAAGAVWLVLPAVLLQLPTNYVDAASAALLLTAIAFVLGPLDPWRIILAGLAIGLFLGSKPTAPIGVALLVAALALRAHRAGLLNLVAPATLIALLLGGESYVVNLVRLGNPVWPVRFDLGPLQLPGTVTVSELLASGAAAPHVEGNVLARVVGSWPVIDPPLPAFDMRIGGLGLLFLVAVAVAAVRGFRRPSLPLAMVVAATLATPDPAVARYVLAFAGLSLALAVPALDAPALGRATRAVILGVSAVLAVQGVVVAYPGLTGEGPTLSAYVHMTQAERQRAVGADGPPAPFFDAVAQLGPDEIAVFDRWADLPYLAWPSDLSRRATRIPDNVTTDEAEHILGDPSVRLLIVGDDTVTGAIVRRSPQVFLPQFHCKSSPCTVYLRR